MSRWRDEVPVRFPSRGTIRPFARITEVRVRARAPLHDRRPVSARNCDGRGGGGRRAHADSTMEASPAAACVRRDKMIALIVLEN